ncbi:MAG TPA: hypothetical protein VFF06_28435 [Polyangia bacterium]|nr:hypothetical protein [Polyangia bacterium]
MRGGPPTLIFWVLAAACPLLVAFTSHKLYDMARLRGWIGAVRVERQVVRGKAQIEGEHGPVCWVSWTERAPTLPGNHRSNVECDRWRRLQIGAPIEVLYLPDPDGEDDHPYLRDGGIYASDGNFAFDLALLALELGGCVYFALRLVRRKRDRAPIWPG